MVGWARPHGGRTRAGTAIAIENVSCSFGESLRHYREAAGLSQEELAERAGLSTQAIGALERGERTRPYSTTVRALAAALDLGDEARAALLSAVPSRGKTAAAPVGPTPVADQTLRLAALPVSLTPLLGRAAEVTALTDLLSTVRLLTLTGPGGVGKTTLALHIAATTGHLFLDGAAFVSLASLTDPEMVLPAIAQALGVREGGEAASEILPHALRGRRLLVVLDNCEQVLGCAAGVAALLQSCPDLVILATSRAPLHVRGEQEYPLDSLFVPPAGWEGTGNGALRFPAVQLFVERARAASPGFRLTAENAEAVAAICRRLDGLPLAIELAAPRIKLLSPAALLQRLERRLTVLTGGPADLPARQQTLRNAVDWSYSLLAAAEQTLFARLSVFAGGFAFEDAEAVCVEGSLDVLTGITSLLGQSLLRQQGGDLPRIDMLETMREFAAEKLAEMGETDSIGRAHAMHFLSLAEEAGPQAYGPNAGEWLARLDGSLDNLRAALRWLLDHSMVTEALRLATALQAFWRSRGYWREGQHWLEEGLASGEGSTAVRGAALLVLGSLLTLQGDCGGAGSVLESAVATMRELGDVRGSAEALAYLALTAYWRADFERAMVLIRESDPLWLALDDRGHYASHLGMWGAVAMELGDFREARDRLGEAIAIARVTGGPDRLALELAFLGHLAYHEGTLAEAQTHCEEALALAEPLAGRRPLCYTLLGLGLIATATREIDQAVTYLEESLRLAWELDYGYAALLGLGAMAVVAAMHGDGERTAYLKGAEAALRAKFDIPLPPSFRTEDEDARVRARELIGEEAFTRAWMQGQGMNLQEAVAYALGEEIQSLYSHVTSRAS